MTPPNATLAALLMLTSLWACDDRCASHERTFEGASELPDGGVTASEKAAELSCTWTVDVTWQHTGTQVPMDALPLLDEDGQASLTVSLDVAPKFVVTSNFQFGDHDCADSDPTACVTLRVSRADGKVAERFVGTVRATAGYAYFDGSGAGYAGSARFGLSPAPPPSTPRYAHSSSSRSALTPSPSASAFAASETRSTSSSPAAGICLPGTDTRQRDDRRRGQ
jgi:hypothetical protein